MQAVVYHAPGDIRVEDIPQPECGPGELLVRVDACAVCGTDLKSRQHGNPRIKAPLVMGHEFTGIVVESRVAEGCTEGCTEGCSAPGLVPVLGDRVVMATSISCGQCYYCRRGWRNLCENLAPMGFSYPGGMAEYVAIPALALQGGHVIKVPPHVEAKCAALAEPVSCAVNCVKQCGVQQGDTVLVLGAGPMGLLNALVSRAAGATTVLISEPNPLRRAQAAQFEIDHILDPGADDVNPIVRDLTGGRGADVVIVAAPSAAAQEQALSLVRRHGTVCLFASLPVGNNLLTIDSRVLHYGEIRLIGSSDSTPEHVQEAVEMISAQHLPGSVAGRFSLDSASVAGRFSLDSARIASHCLPLDQIEQAFDLMIRGEALRVVLLEAGGGRR